MLTSRNPSNEYLKPDYLTPFSSSLDAKNSPLALLAQTCSAIGSESPNPKLLANIEKSVKTHKNLELQDKLSPSSLSASSSDSNLQTKTNYGSSKPLTHDKVNESLEDQYSSRDPNKKKATKNQTYFKNEHCQSNISSTPREDFSVKVSGKTPSLPSSSHEEHNSSPNCASSSESIPTTVSQQHPFPRLSNYPTNEFNLNSSKTACSFISPSNFSAYSSEFPYPTDLIAANTFGSHYSLYKPTNFANYLNYAQLKNIDPNLFPVCRDPYCTECSLSPHLMNKAVGQPCPNECTQCEHSNLKSYQNQTTNLNSYAAHNQLATPTAAAPASQYPYICNWIAGEAIYCGKKFATSEELFQHLRTHTILTGDSMFNASVANMPFSYTLFQRSYPLPLLNSLSLARFHPYTKPSMYSQALTSSTLINSQVHPTLSQQQQLYSFYGSRFSTPSNILP